jgi:hypothetical protein
MRLMLMRSLLFSLVVFAWAMPVAAQIVSVKSPIEVIGDVQIGGGTQPFLFTDVLVSVGAGCDDVGNVYLSGRIVDGNTLEFTLEMDNPGQSGCNVNVDMTVAVTFPIVGGAGAHAYIDGESWANTLTQLDSGMYMHLSATQNYASEMLPGTITSGPFGKMIVNLVAQGFTLEEIHEWESDRSQRINTFIPGDRITFPVTFRTSSTNLVGTVTTRFSFKVLFPQSVPEPSAALSLPIGVLGLAGLAAMKGGA